MIEIKNLNFSYNDKQILKNINFSLEKPEFLCLLGPNGSGKTTLLKNICGLLKVQDGKISFDNKDLLKLNRKDLSKNVAIVNQNQENPYEYFVKELVEMGTYVLNLKYSEKKNFLEEIYKLTEIEEFLDRSINTLSGGEKQRVYLARALGQNTPLLLLDEPISNLDLKHQVIIMELCKTLVAKGITVISVLHDINFALNYSDKVILMKKGEIKAFGDKSIVTEELIYEVFEQEVEFIKYKEKIIITPKQK